MEKLSEWWDRGDNSVYTVLAVLTLLVLVLVFIGASGSLKEEAQFMSECQRDHKHYECVAMWRAGEKKTEIIYTNAGH